MGRFVFRLPDIGEGIAEAEIVAWHVKVGDRVEEDGRLADMMTDKATVEMESPVAGKVLEVAGEVGDVIAIGTPLVVLEIEGDVAEEPAPAPAPAPAPVPVPARARVVLRCRRARRCPEVARPSVALRRRAADRSTSRAASKCG